MIKLDIVDYSKASGLSISTIRRRIRTGYIKVEEIRKGNIYKYVILTDSSIANEAKLFSLNDIKKVLGLDKFVEVEHAFKQLKEI